MAATAAESGKVTRRARKSMAAAGRGAQRISDRYRSKSAARAP
jgi:hypothetical protein